MTQANDPRRIAPATARNRDPILAILRRVLPASGTVVEIASGSGEHALYFGEHLPGIIWQPSDPSIEARMSIAAWLAAEGSANVRAPIDIDAASPDWPVDRADAIVAINMVHISPWDATLGLLDGAARLLPRGGLLYLYGPYRRAGVELEPGNAAFDADLRRRDPRWGIRAVAEVAEAAESRGLYLEETITMPANNLSLLFRKR